jgi:hypothetical protein
MFDISKQRASSLTQAFLRDRDRDWDRTVVQWARVACGIEVEGVVVVDCGGWSCPTIQYVLRSYEHPLFKTRAL